MADRQNDKHLVKCKVCQQEKKRIRAGKFGGRTPRWIGEDDLLWNGLVCGLCHRKQTAVRAAIKKVINND